MAFDEMLFGFAVWAAVGVPYGLLLVNMPAPENKLERILHSGLVIVGLVFLSPILLFVFLFGVITGLFGLGDKNDS